MPESQNTEYKESWRDEYLKWICGFANAQGGRICIGVRDDGEVVGVPDSKRLLEEIPNKVRDAMGIVVDVNLLEKDGHEYIEINVPAYPVGISCRGVYHYRSGSTKQVLSGPALESFLLGRRGVTWDNTPLPVFRFEDVDDAAIEHFKALAVRKGRISGELLNEPTATLLEKLHLVNGGYLNNAAMLLFSKDPERYQLGAYLKIGYFETDADLRFQDEIHGPLLEQADKAVELIYLKYMKAKISYDGLQRMERYFVPAAALREALLNAICHKQYQSGIPIQISVYDDKLYVANAGCLPENWTAETLMQKHASKPHNPNIANVFYLAGFIESWGRGIEKICSALSADDLPMPEYTVHPGDIMVKFAAPDDHAANGTGPLNRQGVGLDDGKDVGLAGKIMELVSTDPEVTIPVMAEQIHVTTRTIERTVRKLRENGRLTREGGKRYGRWVIVGH